MTLLYISSNKRIIQIGPQEVLALDVGAGGEGVAQGQFNIGSST